MREEINVLYYASQIMKGVSNGVLLTTKTENKVNTMTISWGTFGIEWGKLIFTAFVRENRFTIEQLEKNPEFTINIPVGDADDSIIGFCGYKSGRDTDKISEMGLTLVDGEKVSVPAVKEFPLTLEYKVVYRQKQDISVLDDELQKRFYPQDVDSFVTGANKDSHVVICGEIVDAYIIQ